MDHNIGNVRVASSNLVSRSNTEKGPRIAAGPFFVAPPHLDVMSPNP